MLLKKLEISGFKSFASKTTLDFLVDLKNGGSFGITTIVGPNGSGKSNIADAMRWVMGEQSMKNLRGKKAEDIIFAGSGKKARLGSASVALYLDNSDKKIPLEFSEVAIARKIFRSGESEYSINGSRVRLQDVVEILAKAGVGKESYAIINQGMADSVLNATPAERRVIVEDAAGVKQYQLKKERSFKKLELTRQNMEKVKALTEEIKPHLKILKRQAERASQSEEVARELFKKQNKLFFHLWHNFQKEKEVFTEAKEEVGRQMLNMQREVDKISDEIKTQSGQEMERNKQVEWESLGRQERNKLNSLERDLIITEGRIEIEKEKQTNFRLLEEIRTKSIPVDLGYVKMGIEEIRKEQEKLVERISQAEKIEDLQEIKEFARVIQQRLYDLKADIEKGKKEEKIVSKESPLVEKAEDFPAKILNELQEKISQIRQAIEKSETEIKRIEGEIEKEESRNREKRKEFFEVEALLRKKQEALDKLRDQFNDSKIALAKVEVREEDLKKQAREELKKNIEELEPDEEEAIDQVALETEIRRLKIKMEQIGGIDPMVVEEYEETSKRYEFLTKENADLEKTIISLKEVIKEMEQEIEKEFSRTYEEINKEFSKYFKIIFGGGSAHLAKIKMQNSRRKNKESIASEEENDSAESTVSHDETEEEKEEENVGIEISACPPGKKISHLSMLSGGERSLTSLALLFAIISHNPPPFAVLDEVEAALDEANSRRFGRILTELSNNTQFVIITHNRETMRQASLLYGVTMGEDGISKLLSVKLDQVGQGGRIIDK